MVATDLQAAMLWKSRFCRVSTSPNRFHVEHSLNIKAASCVLTGFNGKRRFLQLADLRAGSLRKTRTIREHLRSRKYSLTERSKSLHSGFRRCCGREPTRAAKPTSKATWSDMPAGDGFVSAIPRTPQELRKTGNLP